MTRTEFKRLPEPQQVAMIDLQSRSGIPWTDFLAQAIPPTPLADYVALPNFHGMYVAIESDGYTHT